MTKKLEHLDPTATLHESGQFLLSDRTALHAVPPALRGRVEHGPTFTGQQCRSHPRDMLELSHDASPLWFCVVPGLPPSHSHNREHGRINRAFTPAQFFERCTMPLSSGVWRNFHPACRYPVSSEGEGLHPFGVPALYRGGLPSCVFAIT